MKTWNAMLTVALMSGAAVAQTPVHSEAQPSAAAAHQSGKDSADTQSAPKSAAQGSKSTKNTKKKAVHRSGRRSKDIDPTPRPDKG